MPIAGASRVARILLAETGDLQPDPAIQAGLSQLRQELAALIAASDDGIGFAPPLDPTIDDLARPDFLAAWQDCNAAAAAAVGGAGPRQVAGRPANAAFIAAQDPKQDAAQLRDHPWLRDIAAPVAVGAALHGGRPVQLYLFAADGAAERGRYPRGPARPVRSREDLAGEAAVLADAPKPGFSGGRIVIGALLFVVALALLLGAGLWAASAAHDAVRQPSDALRAALAALPEAERRAEEALEAARGATPESRATLTAPSQKALNDARATLRQAQGEPRNLTVAWLLAMFALFFLLAVISWGVRSQILGFLVDERGRMSLARFQFVAWTLVVLGGYWTAALWNVGTALGAGLAGLPPPARTLPAMQADLWILLGIVTGSPLLSALILDTKATAAPSQPGAAGATAGGAPAAVPAIAAVVTGASPQAGAAPPPQVPPGAVGERGVLDVRTRPGNWSFLDLFLGEELNNRAAVDISRVQQFVFTLVLLVAFLALLAGTFAAARVGEPIARMPELDLSLVGLLGLSHAAYLAAKAIPKSA